MPTNVYFDTGTTSEQRLYEDLIIEQLKIYGQDVYYLPRKLANKDTISRRSASSLMTHTLLKCMLTIPMGIWVSKRLSISLV